MIEKPTKLSKHLGAYIGTTSQKSTKLEVESYLNGAYAWQHLSQEAQYNDMEEVVETSNGL